MCLVQLSGLLLCARSPAARRQLTADFANKTQQQHVGSTADDGAEQLQQQQHAGSVLRKLYLALVSGSPAADCGSVDVPIGRIDHAGLCSGLYLADAAHGKPAKSVWNVIRRLPQQDASVLAVEILSGGDPAC